MLYVIGCGNPNRQDDGIGVAVVQRLIARLARHPVPGVRAVDCGTAGMEVMFAARGADALVLVDACVSGGTPGAIFEVPGEELAALPEPSFSLHDFRWDHALAAGRKIFKEAFPEDVTVFLVEARATGFGLERSPEVDAAGETVFARLLERVAMYAARRHAAQKATVTFRRGSLRLSRDLYERCFDGRDGAVLLPEDGRLRVLPVDQVAGGVLVKRRNAAGDRVLDATDALRVLGWDDWGEYDCPATWDPELGALAVAAPMDESQDRSPRP